MKTLLGIVAIALSGCAVPPFSCEHWHHTGNYGPVQTSIDADNVVKSGDRSFSFTHYHGRISVFGFGPEDDCSVTTVSETKNTK